MTKSKEPVMNTGKHTESFSFTISKEELADPASPTLFTLDSKFDGETPPEISFKLGDVFDSLVYDFGAMGNFHRNQWRVPPFVGDSESIVVSVRIPNGTTLEVRSFGFGSAAAIPSWNGGLRLNAHLGFWGYAPENTMAAFSYAAACGYPACIAVPKVTKDGVFVCIHDDAINRTARDDNGGNAGDEHVFVRDMTYDELLKWEFGSFKHRAWKGEKIPLLSDFFGLCAKTGMRPMFSTHPALTGPQWAQVRQMLRDYGLTKRFNIKSFDPQVLRAAWRIFGSDIEGYTLDCGDWDDSANTCIATMDSIGFDKSACRVGIELYPSALTRERIKAITDSGYFAACWGMCHSPAAKFRAAIKLGVTEFTDDFNCCAGLDW